MSAKLQLEKVIEMIIETIFYSNVSTNAAIANAAVTMSVRMTRSYNLHSVVTNFQQFLFASSHCDFRKTYFLVAGIGGGNPHVVTSGSVTFARFAIQADLQYEIDAREIPANWTTGYW